MKTEEKYLVINKGIGKMTREDGTIMCKYFVIIGRKWFWNRFILKTRYYLCHTLNSFYYLSENEFCSYHIIEEKEKMIEQLDRCIDNFFNDKKFDNIVSYKETTYI
jgi:hypothetical protein